MSKYEVRQLNPAKQRLLLAVLSLVVLALVVASFCLGLDRAGKDFDSLGERVELLNEQLAESKDVQQQLRDDATVLQRSNELDHAAMQAAKDELASVQNEMVELRKELIFYQSLLSPQDRDPGLHIQSMQLENVGAGLYRYILVLTQVHQNGKFTKGQVLLGWPGSKVAGTAEEPVTEWFIKEQLDKHAFQFKFFQRIEGQLQLTAGTTPQQLMIKVEPIGRRLKSFEQFYDWGTLVGESL